MKVVTAPGIGLARTVILAYNTSVLLDIRIPEPGVFSFLGLFKDR
jgi:hypothetical protein